MTISPAKPWRCAFDAQINRLKAADSNVNNAVSYSQTQDGFLGKVKKALDRMSELAVLSQDITKVDSDRSLYQSEFSTLGTYINNLATKDFNGVSLFDGVARNVTNDSDAGTFAMSGVNLTAATYATATASSVATTTGAVTALTNVKNAITLLTTDRATVGANVTRLNYTHDQIGVLTDNLQLCQQPHQRCGCRRGKHSICQIQHPGTGRHRDVGTGEQLAAVSTAPLGIEQTS